LQLRKIKPSLKRRLVPRVVDKMNVSTLVEIRQKELEPGLGDQWMWPIGERGAWNGPFTDWQTSHRHKYFDALKGTDLIITAGANMGVYVRAYAKRFKNVYAFEPDWLNFYCMSYNTPCKHIYHFHAALGPRSGVCIVDEDHVKQNRGTFTTEYSPQGRVPMFTIDSLCVPKCDMIQLDVEGYEYEAIQGAEDTIRTFKPVVIIENKNRFLFELLTSWGYKEHGKSISDYIWIPN